MKIFAHRGASRDAPENTLEAFRLGWQQHADGAELDVHLSRDGKIIVCHDPDTKRTTGQWRLIAETDSAELHDLPQLGDFVAEIPEGRELLVEVKCGTEIVPALLAAKLPADQISFLSFNREVLAAIKSAMPVYRCRLNVEPFKYDAAKLISLGRGFDGVSLGWHKSISKALVDALHAAGLTVAVWTIDDPKIARLARDAGVDVLMTNRPREMVASLNDP
jgi:glycerophosphoryl diester phosphodiesterase